MSAVNVNACGLAFHWDMSRVSFGHTKTCLEDIQKSLKIKDHVFPSFEGKLHAFLKLSSVFDKVTSET